MHVLVNQLRYYIQFQSTWLQVDPYGLCNVHVVVRVDVSRQVRPCFTPIRKFVLCATTVHDMIRECVNMFE